MKIKKTKIQTMNPIIIENIKNKIIWWERNENGVLIMHEDPDFKPYFYVEDPNGEYISIYEERVKKIVVNDPYEIYDKRAEFEKSGKKTYEADVKYTVRYLIDKFDIPFEKSPIRMWYFDVEVMDSLDYHNAPKPIIAISIYDNFDKKFYSLGLGVQNKKFTYNNGEIYIFEKEEALLNYFIKLIQEKDPDLLIAWNIQYDINYLVNRMRKLGLNYNKLSRLGKVVLNENHEVVKIYGRSIIDMMELYRKLESKASLESASLENVAEAEDLPVKKLKRPALQRENILNVIAYNKTDVQIMIELENKKGIISFWDEVRRIVGLSWNNFMIYLQHSKNSISAYSIPNKIIVDTYLLRKAKKKGLVLPTSHNNENAKKYGGAIPILPPTGIFKNVVVLDVVSMYPNIIRTYNISPETLNPDGKIFVPGKEYLLSLLSKLKSFDNKQKEDIKDKIVNAIIYQGQKFKNDARGLIAEASDELFNLRKQYKKLKKEFEEKGDLEKASEYDNKQRAIKIIINSLYGIMGDKNYRLYKPQVAEAVTTYGKALLLWISSIVESAGYKILYGDTDSVFVKLPDDFDDKRCLEEAQRLVSLINNSFSDFSKQFGADKHYHEIELKFIFKRVAFFGVKKRYMGYFINEEGEWKEGFEIKGLQIVRSDANKLTKDVLQNVLKMLLVEGKTPDEILNYINKIKDDIRTGKIPVEKLVWKVSYDPNKKYKNVNIPHLRGLRYAKRLKLIDEALGKIVWIYIKDHKNDTIALPEDKIDLLKNFKINYEKVIVRSLSNIEELIRKLKGKIEVSQFMRS